MAQQRLNRLTGLQVSRAENPGLYPDGGGLYLQVSQGGAKSWLYRYEINGRERQMGLGSLRDVTLQAARQHTGKCRVLRQSGIDPLDARNAEKARTRLDAAQAVTFREAADRFIEAHAPGWRNSKHRKQWTATLSTHAYPILGGLSVQAIDTPLVLKVLEPIWTRLPETAGRVRGRVEAVLDACKARGERQGENPARWKGHLDAVLPARSRVRRVKHHPALPHSDVATFVAALREQPGTAARALEFVIHTAARTGEAIGARWSEIDFDTKVWTVPNDRMKAQREHRVPLSPSAVALLKKQRKVCDAMEATEFVFPSEKGRSLSNGAMLMLLERMKRGDITVHGFRSTFRNWVAEMTAYSRDLAEVALAHVPEDKTEAAYLRSDRMEQRRRLMDEWSRYCQTRFQGPAKVVPIRKDRA